MLLTSNFICLRVFIWINLGTLERWVYCVRKELGPVKNLKWNIFLCSATCYYGVLFLNCSSCPSLLSTDLVLDLIGGRGTWWFSFQKFLLRWSAGGGTLWFPCLAITVIGIVCKQLFRRELCFHVRWEAGVVALQKLFRMKKMPIGHKNFARCPCCFFKLANLHCSACFQLVPSIPGSINWANAE